MMYMYVSSGCVDYDEALPLTLTSAALELTFVSSGLNKMFETGVLMSVSVSL